MVVSFATLILALVTGIHPVEVMVDRTVVSVEMRLDGEVVGRLSGEPWRMDVDFVEREPQQIELSAAAREHIDLAGRSSRADLRERAEEPPAGDLN